MAASWPPQSGELEIMSIDPGLFVEECIRQGVFFAIDPHYLAAVAQFRSGISDEDDGDRIGPFRLIQSEWDANRSDDQFDLDFTAEQIRSPTRQCAVFGLMALRAFGAFRSANGNRSPNSRELYLQQWPGSVTTDLQTALNITAGLIAPAAEAALDDPKGVVPIASVDQPVSGPPTLGPDPVPPVPDPAPGGAPGAPLLTAALLKKRWPRAKAEIVEGIAATAGELGKLGINTPLRMAHFMAQISEESGCGTEMIEILKYSAERMMKVFPKRFPTLASTAGFVNDEKAFGNKVYNGRMGNRSGSDDGFSFRGRGCLQITGRDGYDAIGRSCQLDLVNNPDLAIDPRHTLLIAATEFVKLGCLAECDRDNVVQVSARINLGHPTSSPERINGLAARRQQLALWKKEFGI
jgi:putative chitinase